MIPSPKLSDYVTAIVQKSGMAGNGGLTERIAGYVVSGDGNTLIFVRAGNKVRPVNLSNETLTILPPKPREDAILVFTFGLFSWMWPIGKGAYPYDCTAKTKHPDAMVYENEGRGWTTDKHLKDTRNGYYIAW